MPRVEDYVPGEDERGPGPGQALAAMLPGAVADAVVAALGGAGMEAGRTLQRGGAQYVLESSASLGSLVKALSQARLNFEEVVKDRTANIPGKEGKAGFKYDYATLGSAIGATTRPLAESELVVFQTFEQEPGTFTVVTELVHSSDQFKRSRLSVETPRAGVGPQALGTFITYLRRYSYLGILGLAPTDDDDGADGLRLTDEGTGAPAVPLASLVAVAAYALVRQEIAGAAGAKAISDAQVNRLYAIAGNNEWTRKEVDGACAKLLATEPAKIPWKAYDRACELFGTFEPEQVRRKPAADAPAPDVTPQPEPDPHEELTPWGTEPKSVQPAAPPASTPPADPLPEWGDVWQKVRTGYDDLTPEDAAAHVDRKSVEAIMEGFGRGGWTPDHIAGILQAELGITPYQLPRDGTNPPAYRMIAKAFRIFKPVHVSAEDAERYGFPPVTSGPSVGDILQEHKLADLVMPETAEEAWRPIRAAIEAIGAAHPEALVPISPDDRLTLIGRKDRNGNRSSGDVAALVAHHLGVQVEKLPAVVFESALRVLAAFPSRGPGREELLGRLPADTGKVRVKDLGVVLQQLLREGVLTDEEVPRSGQGNTVSKDDMTVVIERLRERALLEAGRHD